MSTLPLRMHVCPAGRIWLLGLALVGLALMAFWPVFHKALIAFDTDVYIYNNPRVLGGFTRENLLWALTALYEGTWQPLTWFSHMADVSFFGLAPAGHQAVNLALHLASTLLLFAALSGMTGKVWPSAFAAALFCLHPLRVESVAWIAERKGLLSALFGTLCLHAYIRYARAPGLGRYALVALCQTLALMAKPTLMMLPGLLLVLDYWPLARFATLPAWLAPGDSPGPAGPTDGIPRKSFVFLVLEKCPLLLLCAASCVVTYLAQAQSGAVGEDVPVGLRLANCLVSYVKYLADFFWPLNLGVLYPYPVAIPVWQWASAGLGLGLLSLTLVWAARRAPYLLAGWLWFLIGLAPVIGLVVIGNHARADRFTYFPSIGLCFALAWAGQALCARFPGARRPAFVLGLAALLALAGATYRQTGYWRDTVTLFERTLAVTGVNGVAQAKIGIELARNGAYEEALSHLSAALVIHPSNYKARAYMGSALEGLGQLEEAALCYQEVLRQQPRDVGALNNLGVLLAKLGCLEDAVGLFQQALVIAPDSQQAQRNLRKALEMRGAAPSPQP